MDRADYRVNSEANRRRIGVTGAGELLALIVVGLLLPLMINEYIKGYKKEDDK